MTLDEAIQHAEDIMLENLEKTKGRNASDPIAHNCFACADQHRQLAKWLKELKAYRDNRGISIDDFEQAMNVLKEPCEDAISRQAVLDRREILRDEQGTGHQAVKTKYIRELPSVQPKRNE